MSEQYGQYTVQEAKDFLNLKCGQPAFYYLQEFSQLLNHNQINLNMENIGILQYGKKDGFDSFKKQIIKLLSEYSDVPETIPVNHIYMTNGVTQGFQMLTSYFKSGYLTGKPIDVLYIEELTYFLIRTHLENININVKTFSFDKLDNLAEEMKINTDNDKLIAFYIIPFCHNPTGKTLDAEKINLFLKIVNKSIVISDETYLFLHRTDVENHKYKSLYFYGEHQNIISLHTFSKIMSPGLRLGFILTKNETIIKLLDDSGFMDSGGSLNPYIGYIVKYSLEKDFDYYNKKLYEMKNDLTKKMIFIESQLSMYPEHFSFNKPDGGYFIFFETKKIKGQLFENLSEKCNLSFHNANKFGNNSKFNNNYYRLSVSYYSLKELETYFPERLKNLTELIDSEIKQKIWVLGYKGRLGSLIMEELNNTNYNFCGLDRGYSFDKFTEKDIIIDVSSPDGLTELLIGLENKKLYPKIISGTTGNLPINLINSYSDKSTIILKSNFSRGIETILKCIDNFDINFWNIELKEIHHTKKKDSPSGTALTIYNKLKNITDSDINIEAVREGDVIGYHSVTLSTPFETITITHNVHDRKVFAKGCIKLIENIQKNK